MVEIPIRSKYFFKYLILDNFFSDNEMQYFNRFDISKVPSTQFTTIYQARIFKDKNIEPKATKGGPLSIDNIISMHNKYEEFFYSILSKLCPAKSNLIEYIDYKIVVTGKDYKYQIHDDVASKLLSTVIYLKPEKNIGTIIYPCPNYILFNGKILSPSEGVVVDWKVNRALIFSRINQKTWHSYQGDGKSNRLAFVINVGTDKAKEVMEIENSKEFKESITWAN
ncbi:hypothetical protein [Prochlorococcus marinus]|uniref:hypothetical protein n=1 Tax=Prochlorococcus marinus TaxID=1219 RepID=UPI0022B34397|nr:hypothetical protein [Prochlorococcus marinus]